MNELICAFILLMIAMACLILYGVPSIIIGFILRVLRHRKMMRPQNVYFRWEVR